MLSNFFKIAFRNIKSDLYHFSLNLVGLVVGLSCFVALQVYVDHELHYETFLDRHEDIYRVTTYFQRGDQEVKWAITNGGLVDIFNNDIAEVEEAMKIMTVQSNMTFKIEDKMYSIPERQGFWCDSNFFKVLNFPLTKGNPEKVLHGPDKIVISTEFMKKYFGNNTDIIGEQIEIVNEDENQVLQITGVVEVPSNSHLQFDFLFSGPTMGEGWKNLSDPKRGGYPVRVFFKTHPNVNMSSLKENFAVKKKEVYGERMQFPFQSIGDIHFNANNLFEDAKTGNRNFIFILEIISWLILVIACINYVILNTSKSIKRSREIGVRKTLGSSRANLIFQFLTESAVISLLAGLVSLFVIEFLLSISFSQWFGATFSIIDNWYLAPAILLFSLLIGLASGALPAYTIGNYQAAEVLRSHKKASKQNRFNLRTILVVIQFSFTLAIIIGTVLVVKQLDYLRNKDLGYDKDQLISIRRANEVSESEWEVFQQSVKGESAVNNSGEILYEFLSDYNATSIRVLNEATSDTISMRMQWNAIDYDLLPTLGVEFVEGRNFSKDYALDSMTIIVNEAAKKQLGIDTLVNSEFLSYFVKKGRIIGVVKDFHFQSFDKEIIPIMFILRPGWSRNLMVNVNESNFRQAIDRLETHWGSAGIESPFEYNFIDQSFKKLIEKEAQLGSLVQIFSVVSIAIALLGLLGLISHSTALRKKEIGIRKVFGASTQSILALINKDIIIFLLVAFVLAVPLTIWGVDQWLENFAYKTELTYLEFVVGLTLTLFITLTVISVQSFSAANANPANTLKDE